MFEINIHITGLEPLQALADALRAGGVPVQKIAEQVAERVQEAAQPVQFTPGPSGGGTGFGRAFAHRNPGAGGSAAGRFPRPDQGRPRGPCRQRQVCCYPTAVRGNTVSSVPTT